MLQSWSIWQPPQFGLHTHAHTFVSAWYVVPQFKAEASHRQPHCAPLLTKVKPGAQLAF